MTDYNPVVGLPYVVTNELEQPLRSSCGEDAAQALVPTLVFMRTNAPVSEIIKSHAQHHSKKIMFVLVTLYCT